MTQKTQIKRINYQIGSLVQFRDRPWVVLPSHDQELILLKPLGGTDEEITGIYLPIMSEGEEIQSYTFPVPSLEDLKDYPSAKLLFNANRLSFRNVAGPFRCIGKLSFRPRPYQLVPLIMALRQKPVRLLIGDDVGIGKTLEALLIAMELYERKEIQRFAVICLPHLCEQWQEEIQSKFGLDAVIIRSSTISFLERNISKNDNIFRAYPFQVISIDYIKQQNRRQVFIDHCPELIIVDEAHTCAKPAGANTSQQLRYYLLNGISQKSNQNLILLTATPHSGKDEEFYSLLGLLNPKFEKDLYLQSNSSPIKKELAEYFIQRKREDILKWMNEETQFPERSSKDLPYDLTNKYLDVFNNILEYAREIASQNQTNSRTKRSYYWEALALLRGVMSSPAAGMVMIERKIQKKRIGGTDSFEDGILPLDAYGQETVFDLDYSQNDSLPLAVLEFDNNTQKDQINKSIVTRLESFQKKLNSLKGIQNDAKAKAVLEEVQMLLDQGFHPVVFCRYIETANYIGEILREHLVKGNINNLHIEVITGELDDELRKEKIKTMQKSKNRLLIATDCLSEGINLQEGFNAVIHYDLPWNPNRLEQREGRIDRFGQPSKKIEVVLVYGANNPMDGIVLEVLLRKAKEIRKSLGITVPFPENSETVMEAITNSILLSKNIQIRKESKQLTLFEDPTLEAEKSRISQELEEAGKKYTNIRNKFSQSFIKPDELANDLKEVDEAIGDVMAVESFVIQGLRYLGAQVTQKNMGYEVNPINLPYHIQIHFQKKNPIKISFRSPMPEGFQYIGRNHPLTQDLTQYIINQSLNRGNHRASRAAVLKTNSVSKKTVLLLLRIRIVVKQKNTNTQFLAEEMVVWGYAGKLTEENYLSKEQAMNLFLNAVAVKNLSDYEQKQWLKPELDWIQNSESFQKITNSITKERTERFLLSHSKFSKHLSNNPTYEIVEPFLPVDTMGIYIFLP